MAWTEPRLLRRRDALAAGAAFALAGCASRGAAVDRIVDAASGATLTPDDLLARARASDAVLLGELHDNPAHHERRAGLLRALGGGVPVVAEQLTRGVRVAWNHAGAEAALVAAGFDARAWGWPAYRPLFEALAAQRSPLAGANAPRDEVRRVAREGRAALPAELRALLDRAPLQPAARNALEDDLVRGHCGHLKDDRLDAMVWAQRSRDAAMWLALEEARAGAGAGPAVLLAGNGHVRRDYGVPQIAAAVAPGRRVLSVVFAEAGSDERTPCDLRWITPPAGREDPCRGMTMPAR